MDGIREGLEPGRLRRQTRKAESQAGVGSQRLGRRSRAPIEDPTQQLLQDPRFRTGGVADEIINAGLEQQLNLARAPGSLAGRGGAGQIIGGLLAETEARGTVGAINEAELGLARTGRSGSIGGQALTSAIGVAGGRAQSAARRRGLLIGEDLARRDIGTSTALLAPAIQQQQFGRSLLAAQAGAKNIPQPRAAEGPSDLEKGLTIGSGVLGAIAAL